ncbi:hypothetical protein [Methylobacterium sp. ap11]|uniref:hypothetical protein n=1 Tax=Methylobacterium sp. ap11 TaxID=1761799 RepID=UPI0011602229|nr:hypothetical protein [Methylobacterium sp. ap11]
MQVAASHAPPLTPATPPILRGATAGSGWAGGGCPRPASQTAAPGREALSPDLTARLSDTFPKGSDADAVRAALLAEGFRPTEPCRDDRRIERAGFEQRGGGVAAPYPVSAIVAWKRTETGRVEWVKGFVSYLAP